MPLPFQENLITSLGSPAHPPTCCMHVAASMEFLYECAYGISHTYGLPKWSLEDIPPILITVQLPVPLIPSLFKSHLYSMLDYPSTLA